MSWRSVVCAVLLIGLILAITAGSACAENLGPGGGTRVIIGDEVKGPYRLLVTSSPEPAQAGMITYVVRVSDAQTADKIRDAEVAVRLTHGETGVLLTSIATHQNAGSLIDYAAHITVTQAGTWNGVLTISGPAGSTEVVFTQRVLTPRSFATVILIGLPFAGIALLLGGLWYFRSSSSRQDRS